MNDFKQLIIGISVFELFIDMSEGIKIEFVFSLNVKKGEAALTAFLIEWVSLNYYKITMRAVISLRKDSKSRAAP